MLKNEFESCYRQGDYEAIAAYKVDNAVIMAAGFASRFAPLSEITPKALLKVKGEIMIERQIRQLRDAGIPDIYVVVGYKKEMFYYLEEKYDVHIIENPDYTTRNNHSSIYAVRQYLGNTYICSADNYFMENVFDAYVYEPYYSAVYMKGETDEYCLSTNFNGKITHVKIGGANAWCMMGHSYWNREFSQNMCSFWKPLTPSRKPGICTGKVSICRIWISSLFISENILTESSVNLIIWMSFAFSIRPISPIEIL